MFATRPVLGVLIQSGSVIGSRPSSNIGAYNLLCQQRWMHSRLLPSNSLLAAGVPLVIQQRFAARKGTRERKAKKEKIEIKKEAFVPYKEKLAKLYVSTGPKRLVEKGKSHPIDDVYGMRYFLKQPISFQQAVQFHKETNDPTVYDRPELALVAKVELDMRLEKKTRFLDNFTRILLLPHSYNRLAVKKVVAFCKTEEDLKMAVESGAEMAGGVELIKRVMVSLS